MTHQKSVTDELSSLKTTVMQLQGTVSVILAKIVNPNAVIPSGFSGVSLQHKVPQSQSVQTVPTTLQANQNGQHQDQRQVSQRGESLVECNPSDQVQIDQSQHDQTENNHQHDQNENNQHDQNENNQHDQSENNQNDSILQSYQGQFQNSQIQPVENQTTLIRSQSNQSQSYQNQAIQSSQTPTLIPQNGLHSVPGMLS